MGETTVIQPQGDTSHANDGNQEYEQKMLDKADAGLGGEVKRTLLAGKYKTQEDLQKGVLELIKHQNGDLESFYVDLQKNMGKKDESVDAQKTDAQSPEVTNSRLDETEDTKDETEDTKAQQVKLDFDRYSEEYAMQGKVSDEGLDQLRSAGITDEMMETYLGGLAALQKANNAHAFGVVGGEENYAKMAKFAKQHLTPEERAAYNASLVTKDLSAREKAIQGLWDRYTEANPQFVDGGSTGSGPVEGAFQSENEFKAALKDPRYKKDASYRDTVLQKLERSRFYK